MQNKKYKKLKVATVCLIAILLAYAGYAYVANNKNNQVSASNNTPTISETEYKVGIGNINVDVTGSGSINPTDKRTVKSDIDGTVEDIFVKEGDVIEKNHTLISLKSNSGKYVTSEVNDIKLSMEQYQRELNDLYKNESKLKIYAETSGIISDFNLSKGEEVTSKSEICKIKDTDNSYVESYFSKHNFDNINLGDSASIFFSTFFSTQEGEVTSKDDTPVQLGGGAFGYKVVVKTKNPGGLSEGIQSQVTVSNNQGKYESMQNGKITEGKTTEVKSALSGKIQDIYIENGKHVKEGDLIYTLEGSDLDFEIAQKKNEIAKSNDKLNEMFTGGAVYAPMKGTVLNVAVSGEEVVDRNTVLITIADLENMEIIIPVDELDIPKVSLGQEAYITSDVYKDEKYTGYVSKISMEGKNSNGVTTYDVTVKINDRKNLMAGMNVDVSISAVRKENIITVPIDAVKKNGEKNIVMIKDASGNKVSTVVELGVANEFKVEIISGLKEGDIITYMKNMTQPQEKDSKGTQSVIMMGM